MSRWSSQPRIVRQRRNGGYNFVMVRPNLPGDEEIRRQLAVSPEKANALFAMVGAALLQCQNFENRLAEFIVLVFDRKPGMSEAEVRDLVEGLSKKTLGPLLKELPKRAKVGQATTDLLDEFLKERNWLAHRVQKENGFDLFDDAKLKALLQRLQDVRDLALHLQHEFQKHVINYMKALGHSTEQIGQDTVEEIKRRLGK
jgi:hypothetical protein